MKRNVAWLLLTVVLVLFLSVGGFAYNDTKNEIMTSGNPKVNWIGSSSDQLITQYHYIAGFLHGAKIYEYFEVTGGSGQIAITAEGNTFNFNVENGKTYKLSIDVSLTTSATEYTLGATTIDISSPSAETTAKAILESIHTNNGNEVITSKQVTNMSLELWDSSSSKSNLDSWPIPEGASTTVYYDRHGRPSEKYYTSDNRLFDVTWVEDQFVIVGTNGKILTSADGKNWTEQVSGTTNNLFGLTWNGSQFVAVGYSGTILTSGDGISWTKQSSGTTSTLRGVTWSGDKFVAVGSNGIVLTSPDGVTWTGQTSYAGHFLIDVAWSGNQLVAVGYYYDGSEYIGIIKTSPDGKIWTEQDPVTDNFLEGVIWGDSKFIAVGGLGTILTSTDGIVWTAQNTETNNHLTGICWSGTQFVAVGYLGTTLTSPDGITWTEQASATNNWLIAATWNGSQFVAVGYNETVVTSSDGETWNLELEEKEQLFKKWFYNDINQHTTSSREIDGIEYFATAGPAGLAVTRVYYDNYQEITFYDYQKPKFAIREGFVGDDVTITVSAEPEDGGEVTGGGSYEKGAEVTLTVTANLGYSFVNWTEEGEEVSTANPYIFTAEADRTLIANFTESWGIPGDRLLYASFTDAVYAYDGNQWLPTAVAHAPALALAAHGGNLYGAFEDGIYVYDGTSWDINKITPGVASNMASYDGKLYGSFADATYVYDGTSWTLFTWPTNALTTYQGYLYASFSDAVYAYDGNQWIATPVAHAPALALATHGGKLYGAFGDGIYLYDGTSWDINKITPGVASNMASYDGQLYGSFADATYSYDGNQWTLFTWPTTALEAY